MDKIIFPAQKSSSEISMKETASTIDQLDNDPQIGDVESTSLETQFLDKQDKQKIKRTLSFEQYKNDAEVQKRKKNLQNPEIKQRIKKIKLKYIEEVTIKSKQKAKIKSNLQQLKNQNPYQPQSKYKLKAPPRIQIQKKKPLEQIIEAECEESANKLIEGHTLLHINQSKRC